MEKIVFIVAIKNFRDEEFLVPSKMFRDAGYEVVVASTQEGTCEGMLGVKVDVDVTIKDALAELDSYKAVVFAGGSGSSNLVNYEEVIQLIRKSVESSKLTAAICMAPTVFAKAGVLQGKKATVWSAPEDKIAIETLKEHGAIYSSEPVVIDGNIITASGPEAARAYGQAILDKI